MKIYQVGGAVRDRLLNRPVKDRDWVVTGSSPEEMITLGYKPVGKDFPVFLHPETHEEYALARTERKSGKGYKGFVFHTSPDITIEEDLRRRDLTINAIAQDEKGNLIDPFGGKSDLNDGVLRHVSSAFVEDPLRVLRVARFAARFGFRVANETLQLMQDISAAGELETLVPERVWGEIERTLSEKYPARFILVLRACNALQILFPEIERLFGVPQPEKYHPEIDSGIHTMMVLNQATRLTEDPQVRFAALLHDLGKGTTPTEKWPHHHGHEIKGVTLVQKLCKRYKVPRKWCDLAKLVTRYHLDCHRVQELKPGTLLSRLEVLDAFRKPERFEQFLLACEADARGRAGYEYRDYPQSEHFREMYMAAKDIDTQKLVNDGYTGEKLGKKIRAARLQKVKNLHRK